MGKSINPPFCRDFPTKTCNKFHYLNYNSSITLKELLELSNEINKITDNINKYNLSSLEKIIYEWNKLLKDNKVEFIACSYDEIKPSENDFVYLAPPYANTKGMYYGTIDYTKLWDWLRNLPCKYALSFDGISGEEDNTWNVPTDIYSKHEYLLSGNSSFKRTIGKSNDSIVYESLYLK